MKNRVPWVWMILVVGAAVCLASCVSTPESRIHGNPELFASLSPEHQSLAVGGRVAEGMSPDAVFLAWGRPSSVLLGSEGDEGFERWLYMRNHVSQIPRWSGTGHWGHGRWGGGCGTAVFYDPIIIQTPVVVRSATFRNGRLGAWDGVVGW